MEHADGLNVGFLATLPPALLAEIRRQAIVHHHPSGDLIISEDDGRWTGIVLAGMARVFLRTPSGRQVTLRHPRRGGTIGIGAVLGEGTVSAQAVTDCSVLQLDIGQVLRLSQSEPTLAVAIASEVSDALLETYHEMMIREQGTVRQRIARQLLHFGGELDPERPLVVPVSHEALADAVGSAREVVTRNLSRFQADGMLTVERGRITLIDPVALHDAASQVE